MDDHAKKGNAPRLHIRPKKQGNVFWSAAAVFVTLLVLTPVISVVWIGFSPSESIWRHFVTIILPRYMGNTLILAAGTGLLAAAMGTGSAWLISLYEFPGRRLLQWLLLLPLAVPAYIGAYAMADFLDYSGPVQTMLRSHFGWQNAQDYWFPNIRSIEAAVIVLGCALYPYTFLLARTALHEQSGNAYEVARTLGASGWQLFVRVGLPLLRPAIAAGCAIAMMEAVADFGVVNYFGIQTLNTGIFTTWIERRNVGGAAQLSCIILGLILFLTLWERASRKKARYHQSARQVRPIVRHHLGHLAGILAVMACLIPFGIGFVLPVGVMLSYALNYPEGWLAPGLGMAAWHTIKLGGIAAILTVVMAVITVYGVRLSGRRLPRLLLPATMIGYAAPGAVLAVGILIPLAVLDHKLADGIVWLTGQDPGLLLTGTGFAIVFSYTVRFFAIGQGAVDAAFTRIPDSLPMAAKSLGRNNIGVLRDLFLPLMRGSIGSALLLVFVDCCKELPATLMLRPFNYDTLSTRLYEHASLEDLGNASPAALLVVLVGIFAVVLLAHTKLGLHKPKDRAM